MRTVRSFRNSDTHRLAQVWREHWALIGYPVTTTVEQLEQAILDKLFFHYDEMLVLDEGGELIGFAHMQIDTSENPPRRARIASVCVGGLRDS